MIFQRVADIVIRWRRWVILAWVVSLVVSIPLASQVDSVIEYSGMGSRAGQSEAERVGDILATEFPTPVPNSTAIIVIQAWDVRSPSVRKLVQEVGSRVEGDQRLVYLEDFTTVYDVLVEVVNGTADLTSTMLVEIREQAGQAAVMLYLPADTFWYAWSQVQNASMLIYGIPSLYMMYWDLATGNISERDETANASTVRYMDEMLRNATDEERSMAFAYYSTFYANWRADPRPDTRPRAEGAIDRSVPAFAQDLTNDTLRDIVLQVWQTFTLDTWMDVDLINGFTYTLVRTSLASAFGSMFGSILPFYDMFTAAWNDTFADHPALPPRERVDVALNASIPVYISTRNASMRGFLEAVRSWFNLSNYMETPLLDRFVPSYYSALSHLPPAFVQGVYDLGGEPSPAAITLYSRSWVGSHHLSSLGIPVPAGLLSGFISPDNRTMLAFASFTRSADYISPDGTSSVSGDVETLRSIVRSTVSDLGMDGLTLLVSGDAALTSDIESAAAHDLALIEPVTFIAIIVLISIFFYSVLTPWLPLGVVGVAIVSAQAALFAIGVFLFRINYTVLTFLFSVLMAVGTDYSIFLIARFREEILFGKGKEEAVRASVTWAGESIATSGGTVMVSFGVLAVGSSSTLVQALGLAIGVGVALAILVAITLIPAILLHTGERVFWPMSGRRLQRHRKRFLRRVRLKRGYFYRAAERSIDNPVLIVLACVLVSIPAVYIYFNEETSYDFIGAMPDSESARGLDAMAEGFGQGAVFPTYVVVVSPGPVSTGGNISMRHLYAISNLTGALLALENVRKVVSPTSPSGEPLDLERLNNSTELTALTPMIMNSVGKDNRTILFTLTFQDEPLTPHSLETIPIVRSTAASVIENETPLRGSQVLIGGQTAGILEDSDRVRSEFTSMEAMVILGLFILMLLVLGSVPIALASVITIAMSISWAFAATIVVFKYILGLPVLYLVPLILFVILMGIGMDYNVFVLTRVREEVLRTGETKAAVGIAVERTGGIITALALIMAGALGSLMLSTTAMLKEFGFALASAVLIDAMVVRTYLVPAVISLLGRCAWWAPGRLQRVDLERKGHGRTTTRAEE